MPLDSLDQMKSRASRIILLTSGVLVVGTAGYRLFSHGESSWLDCLYMVVITVATIGYEEVVPTEHNPPARIFTMFVALFGIGIITYVMSVITQVAVDGDLQKRWRRKKMQKAIEQTGGHFIICGWSMLVPQILRELALTQRAAVLVLKSRGQADETMGDEAPPLIVEGDPTSDEALLSAGVARAGGLFAADEDDHTNIIISLAARGLKADLRIVAAANDAGNSDKLRKAGASSVVSPTGIGALRMSSEMIRPSVVTFLDVMLRDKDRNLRIEDVVIGPKCGSKTIGDLNIGRFPNTVLLATRRADAWVFNPKSEHPLCTGDIVIIMTTPEERQAIAAQFT